MTDDDTQKTAAGGPDWAKLASAALDLWQDHLTSLANDEKAKEEMAKMIAPMSQMFVDWTNMVQQSLQAMNAYPEAAHADEQSASPESPAADGPFASGSAGSGDGGTDGGGFSAQPVPEPTANVGDGGNGKFAPADTAVPSTRGGAASSDRARDLAQLAGRLAELEQELDGLRTRKRKGDDGNSEPGSIGDDAHVARTGSFPTAK